MSALSDTNWLAAEKFFDETLSSTCAKRPDFVPLYRETSKALEGIPFRRRALAYAEALYAVEAAEALGLPPGAVEPFFATQILYICALSNNGIEWRRPALLAH